MHCMPLDWSAKNPDELLEKTFRSPLEKFKYGLGAQQGVKKLEVINLKEVTKQIFWNDIICIVCV